MTALLYLVGVVLFVIGIAASIGLHELGHLIPGKLFNVKVTQYFIGFGRTLWSRQRGETEYGVKAIPLGGYVKLIGMVPPGPDEGDEVVKSTTQGMFAQLVSDARRSEYEEIAPADRDRLFYKLSWWKRVIVMGSGVSINLILSFLLFTIAFAGFGVPTPTTTIAHVSKCVVAVKPGAPIPRCTAKDPRSPALLAGLRQGDRIVAFNGHRVADYDALVRIIRANRSGAAAVTVVRGSRTLTVHTHTLVNVVAKNINGFGGATVRAGFLGISPTAIQQRQGLGYVVDTMGQSTWETLQTIWSLPQKVYHVGRAALGLEKRNPNGPISVVGAGRIAGEVASQNQISVANRLDSLVLLLAGLNLFLGLINLVPLPPFDGAGIATSIYEAVRRRLARLLGRPDPGPVDSARLLPLTYAMAAVILLVSVVLIYADIVAPVSLS